MKKVITLVMIILMTIMITGCGEKAYNQGTTPNWSDFNANKNDAHVYFAYSQNSFYSDGCLLGNMLYDDFMNERGTDE